MKIESIAGERERTSSFYEKFKKIADETTEFCNDYEFISYGEYNAYFIDYHIDGKFDDLKISLMSSRKLKSTFTGVIPTESVYEEIIELKVKCLEKRFKDFSLEKNNTVNKILSIFNSGELQKLNDNYLIRSKSKNLIDKLIILKPEMEFLLSKNISRFEIDKFGTLRIKIFTFYKTKKELIQMIELIRMIKRYVC